MINENPFIQKSENEFPIELEDLKKLKKYQVELMNFQESKDMPIYKVKSKHGHPIKNNDVMVKILRDISDIEVYLKNFNYYECIILNHENTIN